MDDDMRDEPGGREPTLDDLVQRVRAGDPQGALAAGIGKLARVEARAGAASPDYASAAFEHANLCLLLGMTDRAIALMRAAAEVRGTTPEHEKDRLTYLMNLGDSLAYARRLDEALAVHERGLEERARFYGKRHLGYAYGLDSWAQTGIALRRYDGALSAASEALAIYDQAGHERVAHAWALLFVAAAGARASWQELMIGPEMADRVLRELAHLETPVDAGTLRGAVELIAPRGIDAQAKLEAWLAVQRRAELENDHATRLAALEQLEALAESTGHGALVVDVLLARALTHQRAGAAEASLATYARAVARARALGAPDLVCKALRNDGLAAAQQGREEEGLASLREAVSVAGASEAERALAAIALGLRLQHRGELDEARARLTRALSSIDPAHPDAITARSHLRAIDDHRSCGCGDVGSELQAQLDRMVRERLPEGLLDRLELRDGDVQLHLTRAPQPDEQRLVAETVELAIAEMRRRLA